MNKQEYLERLQACLKHKLSKEEIEDIMRDYAEYFEEGRRQSKQDSEIAAKLGDPELVAEQLIEESQEQQVEYKVPGKGKEKKLGEYVGEYWKKANRNSMTGIMGRLNTQHNRRRTQQRKRNRTNRKIWSRRKWKSRRFRRKSPDHAVKNSAVTACLSAR